MSNAKHDYKKIGLRCGIEIHQRLNTKKLFCSCSSSQQEDSFGKIRRRLRPVAGELGDIDPAALYEFLRSREFVYKQYPNESCLVEADEEPPHPLNREALKIGLEICRLLNCTIPEEIHVMRKTVIDGSNTCGFQRTVIIGLNGFLNTSHGRIAIPTVCLEEEAARIKEIKGNEVIYKLNGLGIPLIEISTSPDIHSPEHAREVAETLGMILRSTNVQRGIGSIRQDINISIKEGARIEIKGFQELDKIPAVIKNEVARQLALLEIKDELQKRGLKKINEKIINVTPIFKITKCDFIKRVINEHGIVLAILLPEFSGLMARQCGDRTFSRELLGYVKAYGVNGFIHSDEDLAKYDLVEEFSSLRKRLEAGQRDVLLIIADSREKAEKAMTALLERIKHCLIGVPEETRVSDGIGSCYTRPLPGAERLYPETDVPPVKIDKKILARIRKPETLIDKKNRLEKIIGKELTAQVIRSRYFLILEKFMKKFKTKSIRIVIASTLVSTMKDLKRKGLPVNMIKEQDLELLFSLVEDKIISKDILPNALEMIMQGSKISDIEKRFRILSRDKLEKIIRKVINENPGKPEKVLMGIIMAQVKGRAAGKDVANILKKMEIKK